MRTSRAIIGGCCVIAVGMTLSRDVAFSSIIIGDAIVADDPSISTIFQAGMEIPDSATNTIQTLVLVAAEPGVVVALGSPEISFPNCPVPKYGLPKYGPKPCLVLRNKNQTFDPSKSQHIHGGSGVLVATYFELPKELWNSMIQTTTSLSLWDKITNTTQELQVLVDPSLRKGADPHFLAATTTIRKNYRYYQGMGQKSNKTKPILWDDAEVVQRLNQWLTYYRFIGVSHFYVVDNEHDVSKPNLLVDQLDVTYIRAPYMPYDVWNCKRNTFTVAGQSILENSMIRMAHTEWLLSVDIDEFVVVGDERFNQSLVHLVKHFEHEYCDGPNGAFQGLRCQPMQSTDYEKVYALVFSAFVLHADNSLHSEVDFQRKALLRTSITMNLDVHYPYAKDEKRYAQVKVPPRQGWMAHYNHALDRASKSVPARLELLLGLLSTRTKTMRTKI